MHRRTLSVFETAMVCACVWLACLPALSADEKNGPTAQTLTWESELLGKSLACVVRLPDASAQKKPVVVYLKHLAAVWEVTQRTIKGQMNRE